jgi:hypothetical protein
MPIQTVINKTPSRLNPQAKSAAAVQPQPPPTASAPLSAADVKAIPPDSPLAALRKQIPKMLLDFEPQPLRVRESNPLLKEDSAAVLLAVSQDLMKKWRQRDWGPNYIQYGKDGPVRYEFEALMDFRERHRVEVRSKK